MIAIPNIEMPKSCWDCELLSSCKAMPKNPTADELGTYTVMRLKDCPLIDIVHCKECIHFHYDKPYIIQGIPVLGHEVCDFWGDGCKTSPNGFCSYGEPRESEYVAKD